MNPLAALPRLAIGEFKNKTQNPELDKFTETMHELISDCLSESQRFSLVERERLAEIIKEIGLSQTDLADPEKAVEAGRLAGANYMLFGSLVSGQGKKEVWLTARMVKTANSNLIGSRRILSPIDEISDYSIKLADLILTIQFPVSYLKIVGRSTIFPGWGQMVIGSKSGKGFFYTAILSLGTLGFTEYRYNQADDEYYKLMNQEFKRAADVLDAQKKRKDRNNQRRIAAGIVGIVWLANIADAVLEVHSQNKKLQHTEELEFQSGSEEVHILYSMRF